MTEQPESRIEESENELFLDLPAAHSEGRMARQVLRRFAAVHGVTDREVETLELVASELLGNAVDHGGGGAALERSDVVGCARVKLNLEIRDGVWRLSVADQGGGEPDDVRGLLDPDGPPDLEDERGRGFFLMKEMVDVLAVEKSADGRGLTFVAVRTFRGVR